MGEEGRRGGVSLLSCKWLRRTQSLGRLPRLVPPSLGLLLRVPLLLQPLGVALGHGVDDGSDKVAHHDQHHLLEHPRQPVLVLETQKSGSVIAMKFF